MSLSSSPSPCFFLQSRHEPRKNNARSFVFMTMDFPRLFPPPLLLACRVSYSTQRRRKKRNCITKSKEKKNRESSSPVFASIALKIWKKKEEEPSFTPYFAASIPARPCPLLFVRWRSVIDIHVAGRTKPRISVLKTRQYTLSMYAPLSWLRALPAWPGWDPDLFIYSSHSFHFISSLHFFR